MVVAVYIKGFLYTDIFIANGYWATIDILVNHCTMNGHAIESIEYHIIPASQTQGFDDVICAEVGEDQVGEAGHGLECHKSAVCYMNNHHWYILSMGVLSQIFCQMGGKCIFSHYKL